MPDLPVPYAHLFALLLTGVAAWTDGKRGIIPNWLTLPALLLWPLVHLATGGLGALATALFSLAVCTLVPLLMFVKGAMGGGDVKLFAALGVALPVETALGLQLLSYLTVAALALLQLAIHGELYVTLRNTLQIFVPGQKVKSPPIEETANSLHTVKMGLGIFIATSAGICAASLGTAL